MIRRRHFIALLGGAVAWPLAAHAQQVDRMRRIGVLIPLAESDAVAQTEVAAFLEGLQQAGWTEGRNARIDIRWAGGDVDRIRKYAKELVALQPDVILARTTPVTAALLQETRTVPIVFVGASDPVGSGFAASMARPGGNATGFTNVEASLGGKWVELLKEINPRIARIGVLWDPQTSPGGGSYYLRLVQDAARSIAVETIAIPVHNSADIERAIEAFARAADAGLLVQPDVTIHSNRALIISLAARYRLPAVYTFPFYATEGGLASYGIEPVDLYRRAAPYVDRILRGAKPSDLPVQAPTKFELVINLKTAKALGIDIPPTLLARADEVIE
jgi:putative tryptophan/tyrosine transport system substrate-binding protein